ncbi:nitrilase-related carbon-nitrogen hydrolase [Radicibacter daui]|uniref:nitrilase-related carbon-nitrogen hydrolase n=1 Tax=Radicibacter daui TaxID=3064829 RepID=UPI004046B58B
MSLTRLDVAICQPGPPPNTPEEALSLVRRWLEKGPKGGLLVMPELALCGYGDAQRTRQLAAPLDGSFITSLRQIVREAGTGLVAGFAEKSANVLYNAVLAIDETGEIAGIYRKVNLWGEHEKGLFTVGAPSPPIRWGAFTLGLLVCHDLDFPETARDLVRRGADVLVAASATNHRYGLVAEKVVPTRAYENVSYIVYADAAGPDGDFHFLGESRIVAPDTSLLARLPGQAPGITQARLSAATLADMRQRHPYLQNPTSGC